MTTKVVQRTLVLSPIAAVALILGVSVTAQGGAVTAIPCAAKADAVIANIGKSIHNSNSVVTGNVEAGQMVVQNSGSTINGTKSSNAPAHLAVVPPPAGATNLGAFLLGSGTRNLAAGNYVASSFTMNANTTLTVSGGVAQIWVTGALVIGSGARANNGGSPQNLEFLIAGNQDAHVNSNSVLFGFIYAPNAAVLVDAPIHGSIVGSTTTINSGGQVIFDTNSACPVCTPGQTSCGGTCTSTQTDPNNCGGCGNVCAAGATCQAGVCTPPIACAPGNTHCIRTLASGNRFNCALITDGTVSCWGENTFGELGNGAVDPFPGLAHPTPATVPGLTGVTALSVGDTDVHMCAITAGGAVSCWGDGNPVPTVVPGLSGVVAVSSGGVSSPAFPNDPDCFVGDNSHNCALLANGTMSCWGGNHCGQLGDGTTISRPNPVTVAGLSGVVAVAAGGNESCAILADGTGRCWGRNDVGALGDGTQVDHSTPAPVLGLSGAVRVSSDIDHACAWLGDGTVRCWGDNFFGQDGVNTGIDGSPQSNILGTPVTVQSLAGTTSVGAGSTYSCSALAGGGVDCWGFSGFGELGNGVVAFQPNPVPAPVQGVSNAVSVSTGGAHACAVLADGTAVCWGANDFGELGNSTAAAVQPTPVPVVF